MLENNPLVTIVCISRNHEKYIEQALRSAINQDYNNLEIIFLDNGSFDKTFQNGLTILSQHNIPYQAIRMRQNAGIPTALNMMIRDMANGEYISFLSGDDWVDSKNISLKMFFLNEHPFYKWVYSYGYHYFEKTRELKHVKTSLLKSGYVFKHFLEGENIYLQGTVFKKKILKEVNFFDENTSMETWDLALKISRKYPVGLLKIPLFYYRMHSSSYGANKNDRYYIDCLYLAKKFNHYPEISKIKKLYNEQLIFYLYTQKPYIRSFLYIVFHGPYTAFNIKTAFSLLKKIIFKKNAN